MLQRDTPSDNLLTTIRQLLGAGHDACKALRSSGNSYQMTTGQMLEASINAVEKALRDEK